jgi:hypothetical protein
MNISSKGNPFATLPNNETEENTDEYNECDECDGCDECDEQSSDEEAPEYYQNYSAA